MRTAAEWVEWMCNTGHFYCESEGEATLTADILARDIEVLQEAAKLACLACVGSKPEPATDGMWWHGDIPCAAYKIWRRVAELKKGMADGA